MEITAKSGVSVDCVPPWEYFTSSTLLVQVHFPLYVATFSSLYFPAFFSAQVHIVSVKSYTKCILLYMPVYENLFNVLTENGTMSCESKYKEGSNRLLWVWNMYIFIFPPSNKQTTIYLKRLRTILIVNTSELLNMF